MFPQQINIVTLDAKLHKIHRAPTVPQAAVDLPLLDEG
jgi:hypothetical protein